MLEQVFDSDALPAGDRLDAWHEVVAQSLIANQMSVDEPETFRAAMRAGELGPAQVAVASYSALRCSRTARLIERSDPEMYMVAVPRRGRQVFDQARRQTLAAPGSLMCFPTFLPYESIVLAGDDTAETLVCQFPRTLLPLPEKHSGRILGRPLPAADGIGALLTNFLTQVASEAGTYLPGDGPRLGVMLLDLVTAVLAHHIEAEHRVPPESRQQTLYVQVRAFIQRNLGDPELTPAAIAAAHHISLRTLHRLFHDHGHSVTAHIRRQRLEHVRRDLMNPALADRPIHALAARWGFPHHGAFTRAFHTAYGTPPREYRHHVANGAEG